MGQKGHKNIMESKIEANEELQCILLTAVLDGTAHYVVAACEDRSGCQAMTALKKWFNGNESQQNTIDRILEELGSLKLDECKIVHEHVNQFVRLIESLNALKEEMTPQTTQKMFLNNAVDLDYENVRTVLKSAKRNV